MQLLPALVVDLGEEAALGSVSVRGSTAPLTVVAPDAGGSATAPGITIDHVGTAANAAIVISRLHPGEKRLVFVDSRSGVESLAAELGARDVTTFVSRASLSVDERQRAEQAFAEARDCVIVSTSTLELGIDVGDLDRVIQIDCPTTVASFLQRLAGVPQHLRLVPAQHRPARAAVPGASADRAADAG